MLPFGPGSQRSSGLEAPTPVYFVWPAGPTPVCASLKSCCISDASMHPWPKAAQLAQTSLFQLALTQCGAQAHNCKQCLSLTYQLCKRIRQTKRVRLGQVLGLHDCDLCTQCKAALPVDFVLLSEIWAWACNVCEGRTPAPPPFAPSARPAPGMQAWSSLPPSVQIV